MNEFMFTPKISFLKVAKYHIPTRQCCDFSTNPRPNFSLAFMLQGTAELYFDDECLSVSQGELIMVPYGATYTSVWNDAVYITMHFLFEYPGIFSFNTKMKIQKISTLDFDAAKACFEGSCAEFRKQNQFYVLSQLYHILNLAYPQLKFENNTATDIRVEAAVDYISHNFASDFTIDKLAAMCNLSVSHFHACFKHFVGCTPIEYKNRLCVQNARLLLIKYPDMSIENISTELGFNSAIYFRRIFKQLTGTTPLQYRKLERSFTPSGLI